MTKHPSEDIRVRLAQDLNRAFESSDPQIISEAIGRAIREYNIAEIARKTGLNRPSIYRAFGGQRFPNFTTVLSVLNAMGFSVKVVTSRSASWRVNLPPHPDK